jgi:hypothetical protein
MMKKVPQGELEAKRMMESAQTARS